MEEKTEDADRARAVESSQDCVEGNNNVGILNTGNRDVGNDDINRSVDTRKIILRVKPDLLSGLNSVDLGVA